MGWKKGVKEYLESFGDYHFPTFRPGGHVGGRIADAERREIPIKWVWRGDRTRALAHMRQGQALMAQLEQTMTFMNLRQGVLRRFVRPDVLIECDKRFGLRTVTITVTPDMPERARELLRDCFANRTVALACVLDVVGVEAVSGGNEVYYEFVCKTCIGVTGYPRDYYCTRGVRYTVAVCDGKGEYLLFKTKAATTDYTPWCPGDLVLVMQHRTTNLPDEILTAASPDPNDDPYAGPPFTRTLAEFDEECVSILPWQVEMAKVREYEIARGRKDTAQGGDIPGHAG